MPYPTQITRDSVIAKASELIEMQGLDQLSLNWLAAELHVKAPSLYRYFASKTDLLRAVNEATGRSLINNLLEATASAKVARERVLAMAAAYRSFAYAFPIRYGLLFANTSAELRPDADAMERLVLPLQAVMAELAGEDESLAALRGLMALVHGYVTLELAGQYRRGGDLDATFVRIIEAYIDGWT
jgi:AcrR family transcriptional regulator